jgi:hypothetical protein
VALPSTLKTTDFVAGVANATMVQEDGRVSRESVVPLLSGPISWLVLVFISCKPVMACDLTLSKMATNSNNNEKRALVFMLRLFWRNSRRARGSSCSMVPLFVR